MDATGQDAVVCRGLEYTFRRGRGKGRRTRAVDGIDLTVRTGEVFGLLGPNGAGKTTTIRAITTLLPVGAGMVRVFGHDAARRLMRVRRLLGYVPQQLSADAGLTGRENVALFARVFDVPRAERAERVAQALAAVGLTDAADRMAATYSGGMVRRLELAQALVSAPRLLVLDEPTIGLDPIARTGVWERIDAVREATGMTVLVTTHYMDEADRHCDRIALMDRGRIRALGTPAELKDRLRRDDSRRDEPTRDDPRRGDSLRDEPTRDDPRRGDSLRDEPTRDDSRRGDSRRDEPTRGDSRQGDSRGDVLTLADSCGADSRGADSRGDCPCGAGPRGDGPTLDDVFRYFAGRDLADATEGDFGDVRRTCRTAGRVG